MMSTGTRIRGPECSSSIHPGTLMLQIVGSVNELAGVDSAEGVALFSIDSLNAALRGPV